MKKLLLAALLLFPSCIEYRLSRPGMPDKYIGWSNTKPKLDPMIGPKTKLWLVDQSKFRAYLGGDLIHREELLMGLGVVYYASENKSFEIGIRDSVYKNTDLLDGYGEGIYRMDPWAEGGLKIFIGGVLIF